jgi:hypothetical protein
VGTFLILVSMLMIAEGLFIHVVSAITSSLSIIMVSMMAIVMGLSFIHGAHDHCGRCHYATCMVTIPVIMFMIMVSIIMFVVGMFLFLVSTLIIVGAYS